MTDTYTAVTTFSPEGFEVYGRRFIETFLEHWPIPLVVYHESQPDTPIFHERLTWRNLDHVNARTDFIKKHGGDPQKVGTPKDPNSQAIRFCHKIYALGHALENGHKGDSYPSNWLLWIDADVETVKPVSQMHLKMICPPHASIAFLGRPNYKYTECGFVAYRRNLLEVFALVSDMQNYYDSGEIFTRPRSDWHDSRCFDICRARSTIAPERQYSLSNCWDKGIHVWPGSPLGQFSVHHKGPGRKQGAYGAIAK